MKLLIMDQTEMVSLRELALRRKRKGSWSFRSARFFLSLLWLVGCLLSKNGVCRCRACLAM